jgi:hypothetical protein
VVECQLHHRQAIGTMHPERVLVANVMPSLASWRNRLHGYLGGSSSGMIEKAGVAHDHLLLGSDALQPSYAATLSRVVVPSLTHFLPVVERLRSTTGSGLQASGLPPAEACSGRSETFHAHQGAKRFGFGIRANQGC